MNESDGCILQGVVLDEIVGALSLNHTDGENMAILESGRDGLRALHRRGVLHGDVKNLDNAMVTKDNRII
jgi:serine/threonine protein kinase